MQRGSCAILALLTAALVASIGLARADECITGFSVVAPELAVPGKTTAVFVTFNNPSVPKQPLNVTLRLLGNSQGSYENTNPPMVEVTEEIKGHGILTLQVPADATGSCMLQTLINCSVSSEGSGVEEDGNCELKSSSEVRLVGPVRDVIVRPAKHAYRPEEIVSFWVLALDHDLQIASGSVATVSVKDPQGTKVAIWDQVPLDEGVKEFSLPLSPYALIGRWLAYVEVEQAEFYASFEVAPGAGGGTPDVSVAEEHYVELRFGNEMRRRYKPGLPFSGKVEAMSTEKSVRVRVKVYDNTTSIYSQDIEISNGEGTFVVPAILADSDIIALQAELVSVESKEIESHYVLAREPIHKWNSSSDCYLLVEGVEHTLQPEESAYVTILSTCPCEKDMHYVITTDGRITDWAQKRHEELTLLPKPTGDTSATCRLSFSFIVKPVMAPVSQLLVYYVTPQGEPVSDVISFNVKLFNKQVSVNIEDREYWLSDQSVDLEIIAEPSSLVCLLGGRASSTGDLRFDPRISEEPTPSPITGEVDFLEAGVSFFQRQCARRGNSGMSAISYRQRGSGAGPSGSRRRPPESLVGGSPLDQLWMWTCFNYSSETSSTELSITTPKEAGKWTIWALTVSRAGLRFSAPVKLQVFRPMTVEFHMPPSLRVRETLEVDIKIGNNINSCIDVTALLALSEGAQFVSNGLLYVTERLRLGPHGATSLVVRVTVTTPGSKNMTVEVNGYTSSTCEGLENVNNNTLSGAVMHSRTFQVYPEGVERVHTESSYFCANENLVVSTTDNYKYEWITAPKNHDSIIVEIKPTKSRNLGPVHLALAENKNKLDKMYRITIGDAQNSVSHIGRGKHNYGIQLSSIQTPNVLGEDVWKSYWISWDKTMISFGNGSVPHNNTLLTWKMDKKVKIKEIGFASAWGALAEFRVWNFNDESGYSQVLHLDTPKNVVPGSEIGQLTISGGLAMPQINKIAGGGLTASLASLTPLLTIENQDKNNDSSKFDLFKLLPEKIQSILSFKKEDDSFSEHPMFGSHKATVSILEVLSKVQLYFSIDPDLIQAVKRWIQLRQEDDGRFTPLDADIKFSTTNSSSYGIPRKNITPETLRFESVVEITAETVIVLYEIGIETDTDSDTLQKAKIFLENSLPNVEFPETMAAVTLALVLVRSATAAWAIEKLRNASTTEAGEFGWPRFAPKRDAADWLYESESEKTLKMPLVTTVEEYKASLYALSTFCIIGDLKSAQSVARFLFYRSHMLDNHYELLYPAVKSFVEYDTLAKDQQRSLTISLATSGMELTETLELNSNKPSQTLYLPSLPTKVFVYATGAGCATIEGKTSYSTYSVNSKTELLEIGSEVVEEIQPDRSSIEEIEGKPPTLKIQTCLKWKGDKPSGVLRMEVTLFSGFEITPNPPQLLNPPREMAEMQHGSHANTLWFVFANISVTCPVCVQYNVRSPYVITGRRPAYARVYPVTRHDLAAETFFHVQGKSSMLSSITTDDVITWFGVDGIGSTGMVIPDECMKKLVRLNSTKDETTSSSVTFVTRSPEKVNFISLATRAFEIEQNLSAENKNKDVFTTERPRASTIVPESDEEYITTTELSEVDSVKKVLLGQVKTSPVKLKIFKPNTKTSRHFETAGLRSEEKNSRTTPNELSHDYKLTQVYKPDQTLETPQLLTGKSSPTVPWTHQTTYAPTTPTGTASSVVQTIRHVNTAQIQDVPEKFVRLKVENGDDSKEANFDVESKHYEYVLLNKESLWSMLKEAMDEKFIKNDIKNILKEEEKSRS
ncbi:C3 and PZP-like alpha-2-macroglobulin domain-containing protein 8 [Sitophilus oryzae]|uniref:C3 and PZP-like alpha-2-macroglobulin domain-containing protein 8 n=1 Tax=Sitophilus oryzae TaxID=7048 RepID=A0A6J2XFV6_SITOR|nr:C3 and PZP-like alpha-2-macroglobulin domain-containing protein 8 [Sitophilus oryzae]